MMGMSSVSFNRRTNRREVHLTPLCAYESKLFSLFIPFLEFKCQKSDDGSSWETEIAQIQGLGRRDACSCGWYPVSVGGWRTVVSCEE